MNLQAQAKLGRRYETPLWLRGLYLRMVWQLLAPGVAASIPAASAGAAKLTLSLMNASDYMFRVDMRGRAPSSNKPRSFVTNNRCMGGESNES